MGLSDDQRAMLRLLAQREEGYEDIAALMGLSVAEIRARVKGALKELDEGGAAAGPVGAGDPPPPPVAEASSGVVPPAPPPAEETPASQKPVSRPAQPERRRRVRSQMSRRRIDLAGAALLIVVVVLFLTGAVDLGGGGSDSDDGGGGVTGATNAAVDSGQITQATLTAVDGGDAAGQALFGRVKQGPVLQVQAEGLDPSPQGQSYAIWLYRSPKVALRVGAVRVGESGGIATQLPMPLDLLGFVANGSFNQVRVSLVGDSDYAAEVARAKRQKDLPPFSGESVLEGDIVGPDIEAAGSGGN